MAPVIPSLAPGTPRPRWSVMIPTFNCANYLRETLASVLAQAPEPEAMQIEVIDDCSTKDDPAAVVRGIGHDRVSFYRQPANVGAPANFNTCLTRSRGELIHVLHGDDLVEPTFYAEIEKAAQTHPNLALFACRSFIIDAAGAIEQLSPRCPALEQPTHDGQALWYENFLPTPGVIIRRRQYEILGGFRPELCHVADWEMWWRALANAGGIQLNRPLVRYRSFSGNDTGRLARSAENLRDYLRLEKIVANSAPKFDRARFHATVAHRALEQSVRFESLGDATAASANMKLWFDLASPGARLRMWLRHPRATLRRLGLRAA